MSKEFVDVLQSMVGDLILDDAELIDDARVILEINKSKISVVLCLCRSCGTS